MEWCVGRMKVAYTVRRGGWCAIFRRWNSPGPHFSWFSETIRVSEFQIWRLSLAITAAQKVFYPYCAPDDPRKNLSRISSWKIFLRTLRQSLLFLRGKDCAQLKGREPPSECPWLSRFSWCGDTCDQLTIISILFRQDKREQFIQIAIFFFNYKNWLI